MKLVILKVIYILISSGLYKTEYLRHRVREEPFVLVAMFDLLLVTSYKVYSTVPPFFRAYVQFLHNFHYYRGLGKWRLGADFFSDQYSLNYVMATYSKVQVC